MDDQTLYQRALGDQFARLPPVLRAFHSLPQGGMARGVATVRRGRGWWRHLAAQALRLPPAGECVPVVLQVQVVGDREIWVRDFGGFAVRTEQWQRGDFFIEKAGPLCFVFRLRIEENSLRFVFQHNELCGLRWPRWQVLRVEAVVRSVGEDANSSWHVEVSISTPLLGLLTAYSGEITPGG